MSPPERRTESRVLPRDVRMELPRPRPGRVVLEGRYARLEPSNFDAKGRQHSRLKASSGA